MSPQRKPDQVKIAVGYCRCSTDEQGATSIPQQKEEIERWAIANDFKIVEWFCDEGKSGTSFQARPGFMELVRRVENDPDFEYVLVYDESRWGRALNPRENSYWKVHFERHDVKVRVIHSNSKNGDDIGSYVVEVVESAEASEYSKKLSRAIRRGMLSSQQGIYSRGGTAPYGYKRIAIDLKTGEKRVMRDGMRSVPKQEKVVWELGDELEINTVRRIFEMRGNGVGYVGIADILNTEGIPCAKRGRWRNKDQKWTGVTVLGIIQNPAYIGDRVYNRLSFSKILAKEKGLKFQAKWFNDKSQWIVVPNAHPAIVTRKLFEKANVQSEPRPTKPNQHYYRSAYLLTGLVKCVHCGFNFQGYHHKPTGNKYYIDGGYVNKGKSVCRWFSIRQDKLEDFVLSSIKHTFFDSSFTE
ncbi:MAG: recombinase family protein, partial [Bacteroidota bacterium]